ALALAVLALRPDARAADTPFKGVWKLTVTDRGSDIALLLLRVEGDAAAPTVTVLDAGVPRLKDAKVTAVAGDAGGFRFTLSAGGDDFRFAAQRSKGDAKLLLGSAQI